MDIQALKDGVFSSPAFVVDELEVLKALRALAALREQSGCKILYSIKALPLSDVLALAKPYVDGFSVSSLFEARLASEILDGQGTLHLTTPGIRPDEIAELTALCTHISGNSLSQFRQVASVAKTGASLGLRINPKLSFTNDIRHDPCRLYSKLGVDIADFLASELNEHVKGLHFHTVFSAMNYTPLIQTLDKLKHLIDKRLANLDWMNLGGGYLYDQIPDNSGFINQVISLKNEFDLDIFIEPGNAVVGEAGYLLTTVIDCFNCDGKAIAVLDSSINHNPQVFEYQRQPELYGHNSDGAYSVILAGSTCLAGDLFGEYRFNQPLSVGDKLVFKQIGAYSIAKANRFNGYNLPDIYTVNSGQIRRIKRATYQDYRQQWVNDE